MTDFVDCWHLLRRAESALALALTHLKADPVNRYAVDIIGPVWETVHDAVEARDLVPAALAVPHKGTADG